MRDYDLHINENKQLLNEGDNFKDWEEHLVLESENKEMEDHINVKVGEFSEGEGLKELQKKRLMARINW